MSWWFIGLTTVGSWVKGKSKRQVAIFWWHMFKKYLFHEDEIICRFRLVNNLLLIPFLYTFRIYIFSQNQVLTLPLQHFGLFSEHLMVKNPCWFKTMNNDLILVHHFSLYPSLSLCIILKLFLSYFFRWRMQSQTLVQMKVT